MSNRVFCKPIMAAGLALLLAGCEHGNTAGVGAGTSEEGSQESGSVLERVKEMLFSKSRANAIEIPLAGVINDGLTANYRQFETPQGFNLASNACYAMAMPERYGKFSLQKAKAGDLGKFFDSLGSNPPGSGPRGLYDDYQYLKTFTDANYPRLCATLFTHQTVQPLVGWPGSPWGDGLDQNATYAFTLMIPALATNNINTVIAAKLGNDVWSDDAAVKQKANAILDDLVKSGQVTAMIRDAMQQATQADDGKAFMLDYTGHAADPVHFQTPSYDFRGNGNGLQFSKSGITWFGDGYYSGKKYTVAVETLAAGSMSKRSSLSDGQSTKSAEHQDSSVNVQN